MMLYLVSVLKQEDKLAQKKKKYYLRKIIIKKHEN